MTKIINNGTTFDWAEIISAKAALQIINFKENVFAILYMIYPLGTHSWDFSIRLI
jgi:hypothetical protein